MKIKIITNTTGDNPSLSLLSESSRDLINLGRLATKFKLPIFDANGGMHWMEIPAADLIQKVLES